MESIRYTPEDPDDDVLAKLRREREHLDEEISARATHVVGQGVRQHIGGEQLLKIDDRYQREYDWARKAERHLWVATCAYVLSDDAVGNMATESINLDAESLLSAPAVGCFICEEPYSTRLRHRKCPGEPAMPG